MSVLVDTNVLLRSVQSTHPMHADALKSLEVLVESGTPSFLAIQSAAEFWNVLTRPLENNGVGMPIQEAEAELAKFESTLGLSMRVSRPLPIGRLWSTATKCKG